MLKSILVECDKQRAPHGSPWFDIEKAECSVLSCYQQKYQTKEYQQAIKEFNEMSSEKFDEMQMNKYVSKNDQTDHFNVKF